MRVVIAFLAVVALPAVTWAHPCQYEVQQMQQQVSSMRDVAQGAGLIGLFDKNVASMAQNQQRNYEAAVYNLNQAQARCDQLVYAEQQAAAAARAEEQRAAAQRAAEQRAADQLAAERRAAEQRAAEQRAADQLAIEQRAAEQRAAEQAAKAPRKSAKASKGGCTVDTECKGDRICVSGSCMDPQARR